MTTLTHINDIDPEVLALLREEGLEDEYVNTQLIKLLTALVKGGPDPLNGPEFTMLGPLDD